MTACITNPDIYFSDNPEDVKAAKDGCQDCPLKRFNACRREGWNHEFGIFGGLSHVDRQERDPARYEALVESNQAESTAVDTRLGSLALLESLSGDLTAEQVADALPVVMSDTSLKAKGVALTRAGLNRRQVGTILGVPETTVRTWMYRERKAERATR